MSLRSQTISGVGWTSFAKVIQQGSQFILSIFLMRLLSPDAYGLIGMAMVFIGFANIFKEFGFGSALVQRSHLAQSHYSSTFFLNIGIGAFLTLLFIVLAPTLSTFYGSTELIGILQALSLSFIIASVGIVPSSILQRKMRFDLLSKIEITTAIVPGIIAVIFALYGFGVWALVVQTLLTSLFSSVLYMVYAPWKPQWVFSWRSINDLWAYSASLTGFQFVNYWARSADDLLIGKYMGSASLGNYTRAYTLMLLPIKQVISVINRVMFSALSKIQREKERVKKAYLKSMRLIAFISFPMMVGLFVVADTFVLALFGEKWSGVIPLIQILAVVGITQAMCNPTGWIYQSQGRTDWMFWWGIFGGGSLIVAIVIGVWFGSAKSVAIAYAVANLLITYPCIAIPGKLINMSFWEVCRVVYPSLFLSVIMGIVVFYSKQYMGDLNLSLRLIIMIVIGIITYLGISFSLRLGAFLELKNIALSYFEEPVDKSL